MNEKNKKILKYLLFIIILIVAIISAYFSADYMFTTMKVEGSSMVPTLRNEDKIILYKRGKYKTGDVVVFNSGQKNSTGQDRTFVKRIIGLPGDIIEIKELGGGELYVFRNGEKLEEPYLLATAPRARNVIGPIKVKEGEFFFLGDNRLGSYDSSQGLMGNLSQIKGRVVLKYSGNSIFNSPTRIKRVKSLISLVYA